MDGYRFDVNVRKAQELVFQQSRGGRWPEVAATLLDCQFLLAKCFARLVADLDADFEAVLTNAPAGALANRQALNLIHEAFRLSMHVLEQQPSQFTSQITARLLSHTGDATVGQFVEDVAANARRPWLRLLRPALQAPGTPLRRTVDGHSTFGSFVCSITVMPDGATAVVASRQGLLLRIEVETGRVLSITELEPHFQQMAVCRDGTLGVSSDEGSLTLWDLATGRVVRRVSGTYDLNYSLAASADGERVVSSSLSGNLMGFWDLRSDGTFHTLEGHSGSVKAVAITVDGDRAVSASEDKTLKLWDLETRREIRTLSGHRAPVSAVAISPDGSRVVSAAFDELKVWDIETGSVVHTLNHHTSTIEEIAISRDGRRVVSGSMDQKSRVWDMRSGRLLTTLHGHTSIVSAVAITPDGLRALSASQDETIKTWDLTNLGRNTDPEGHAAIETVAITVSADRTEVVSASGEEIRIWDSSSGKLRRTLKTGWSANDLVVTPDKRWAITAGYQDIYIWDLTQSRLTAWRRKHRENRKIEAHTESVSALALTPDGSRLVSGGGDATIKIWDFQTGRELAVLPGHTERITALAVTPDGKRVISGSADKTLRVWDLETGCEVRCLEGHTHEVSALALTVDGSRWFPPRSVPYAAGIWRRARF